MLNIRAVIDKNTGVPFIEEIQNGTFTGKLISSRRGANFIVHPATGKVKAIKTGNFVSFNTLNEAQTFISGVRGFQSSMPRTQASYEAERESKQPARYSYYGTIERIE